MTVTVSRGYQWVADADRVAHATPARGHHTRTLCGKPVVDPRYAHPAATRCQDCDDVASARLS